MPFRQELFDDTFRSAWRRTLQLWKPIAVWTLFVWLMLTILVVPATTALVHLGFIRGDRLVISNKDILAFLLSPSGVLYLLLVGSLAIIASVVRFAGIFHIVTCQMKDRPITAKELILQTVPTIPKMFRLSVFSIALALLIAAFILAGVGIIYLVFLSAHDINYYLLTKPEEWTHALLAGGIWLLMCAGLVIYISSRISVALPAFLDCNISIRNAISSSWNIMGGSAFQLLIMIGSIFTAWFLLLTIAEASMLAATTFAIEQTPSWATRPQTITSIAGMYVILSQIIRTVFGFLGFSFVSVLITKFYHEDSNLKREAPPAPGFTELKAKLSRQLETYYSPLRAMLVLFILFATGLGTGAYLAAEIPVNNDIKILAHRAGPAPAPENTIAALELAIEQGADLAEIDVMRTADGTVVVFHDRDMMRMLNNSRRIEDVTYPDISEMFQLPDNGFPAEKRNIAALGDMLEAGKGRINFMIELKYYQPDTALAGEVVRIVEEHDMMDQVSIASQHIQVLYDLHSARPDIKTGYISAIAIGSIASLPVQYVAVHQQQISGSLVRTAKENNMDLYAWTVNSPNRVAELLNLGVDGIITDDPAMASEVEKQVHELTLPERLLMNITGFQTIESFVKD